MHRAKSLILSESAFYAAATTSVVDQEKKLGIHAPRRLSFFNLNSPDDNEHIVEVAKNFLTTACPELLTVLKEHSDPASAHDRLVKIGRSINATLRYGQESLERKRRGESAPMNIWSEEEEEEIIGTEINRKLKTDAALKRLVRECEDLAKLLSSPTKIPTVRYGRTGLQMPILNLGCMRFQQSWNRGGKPINKPEQIEEECQENLVNIIKHGVHCGVTHIETAMGYGCSELQIGMALKKLFAEGVCKREDLILQTKGGVSSSTSKSDYKSSILQQIKRLGVGYVDLFSVHGLNTEDHYNWLFNHGEKGNLIEAIQELREEGKIKWIGFSTHGPAHVIKKAIESNAFDYVNLHYHFMGGGYTSAGDGDATFEGNQENVRLARERDMGVFIISPFDKGGRLYAPSHLSRELTLPEMEPMEYGAAWLWHHERHGGGVRVHTIGCGAARPSDLDQPVLAALRSATREGRDDFDVAFRRVRERKERVLGKRWMDHWHLGLPNYTQCREGGYQIGNMVWLYNAILTYGALDFAKDRYGTLVGNAEGWDARRTFEENVLASPAFHWMPGCCYDPSHDYSAELAAVPEENRARVLEAMRFVHEWCTMKKDANTDEKKENDGEGAEVLAVPLEWETAYDMRPWTAFPER